MTQYPSISITTFHDVEMLVRYFESNRGFYDNVVESWIHYCPVKFHQSESWRSFSGF